MKSIVDGIKSKSKVLLFSANYDILKTLKEDLSCEVFLVDPRLSIKNLIEFSTKSLVGQLGEIDKYIWLTEWQNERFDYILIGDELQQVNDTHKFIQSIKNILTENGSIYISVPNIAHNSIILSLINNSPLEDINSFHSSLNKNFFTYSSLINLVLKSDLFIEQVLDIKTSDINIAYESIPVEVQNFLNKREFGNVCRFIWEIKK